MRFRKQVVGVCLLIVCGANISKAGFRDNFSQWSELDSYAKSMYVQGVFDRMTGYSTFDEAVWFAAQRKALTSCALDLKLNAKMLHEAVTKHYQDHPDDWGISPHFVLGTVVDRVCLRYINEERSKVSLDPWKLGSGSISSQLK